MAYGCVPAQSSTLRTFVRSRAGKSDDVLPFSLTKPSWIVRTESNVRRDKWKKPDPPCEICHGTGKVDCCRCFGKGRTNCVHLEMLPKGEWPKWCRMCGGSGLGYCSRCLGTGEYRYIMGFHFMKMDSSRDKSSSSSSKSEMCGEGLSRADRFLNVDRSADEAL